VSRPCELCGRDSPAQPLYPRRRIVKCPNCGLVFYDGAADPAEIYNAEYFAGAEYRDYLADRSILEKNFKRRIRMLRRLAPGGRLLEIGSAYGFFLALARRYWHIAGIEIAPGPARYARETLGLDVVAADLLDLPDRTGQYDVICMWDTLEHLARPVRYIEKAARWLAPGGVLAMTTNDIDSFVARIRGRKWRQIHPPTHMYYFSRRTLAAAVTAAGLTPLAASYVGYYRSYRSMLHRLLAGPGRPGRKTRWLYQLLTLAGRLDLPIYLNLRDIILLTAQKPPQPS